MTDLLVSQSISVARPGAPTLNFPDLSLRRGGAALLLGPSGSGKTSLLSVLAGLLPPDRGAVHVEGRDLYAMPAHERDAVRGRTYGFVFQTLHLLPSLTLRQNVALAGQMAGNLARRADQAGRVDDLLRGLGLADKAGRRPDALSQGEQQRTAIARAVLNRPAILMADEPTSALDDANAAIVMDLLQAQARETGALLLIATHDSRILHRFETVIQLEQQARRAA
jgi:putative ABC transport system ATP-binding protein